MNTRLQPASDVAIIVLAAGDSSRFGKSKQLQPVHGQPLLITAIRAALTSQALKVIVLLGARSDEHAKIINSFPVDVVLNPAWKKGMGSSIKAGLKYALEVNPKLEGALFIVCDQPLITSQHLDALIATFHACKKTVASAYAGTVGVPVLFERTTFAALHQLEDSQGAKKILDRVDYVRVDFPGGEIDIDTPADLEKLD